MTLCSIVQRLLFGQPTEKDDDEAAVYDSYQNILGTLTTISTLLMGFIITGAFISIGYAGDSNFEQRELVTFVAISFKSFILALVSLSLTLILSLIGGQLHAMPGCGRKAARFFMIFAWVVLLAECCVYGCSYYTLEFIEEFVWLNYVSPSDALCPSAHPKPDHSTNNFCARVGIDFATTAAEKGMCGPPQPNQPRRFNSSDAKAAVCSQLDYGANNTGMAPNYWFGWDQLDAYTQQLFQPTIVTDFPSGKLRNYVEMNAKVLGEFACLVDRAKSIKKEACGPKPSSTSCATAISASQAADTCAGGKAADLMKCMNACAWPKKGSFYGGKTIMTGDKAYESVKDAYGPVRAIIGKMKACIKAWTVARIIIALSLFAWTCWQHSRPDKGDADDLDDGEDGQDDVGYASLDKTL